MAQGLSWATPTPAPFLLLEIISFSSRKSRIGLDIAKSVFHIDGVDAEGKVIIRRKLKRRYVLSFFKKS